MGIYLSIMAMSVIGFLIHLYMSKEPKTPLRIVELFLVYQLVFTVGIISFLSFIGLVFMPEYVADFLGWPYCPFEHELGNANLAFGVLGIMCIWFRGNFWLATIVGLSIWLLGDALGHILDMLINKNYAPGNVGVPLYTDIIVPVLLLALLWVYDRLKKQSGQESAE